MRRLFLLLILVSTPACGQQPPSPPGSIVVSIGSQVLMGADNRYCGPGNVPQFGSNEGPAKLPQTCINTARANTPSPGTAMSVPAGGSVQTAYNSAACGDTLKLQAGATFSSFSLAAKGCDDQHWITIETSALSSLPPEGTRITPCYAGVSSLPGRPAYPCLTTANVMAKISMASASDSIQFGNADHIRMIGIEITRKTGIGIVYNLLNAGTGTKLICDQCWVHGDDDSIGDETNHGWALGLSNYVASVDSYYSDFKCIANVGGCQDSQAIYGGLGTPTGAWGTYKIVNNFLEASGEDMLMGGGPATGTPSDVEVRRNHFFKPRQWMQTDPTYDGGIRNNPLVVKNCFELKNGKNLLLEGNVFEDSWGGFTQVGNCVTLTPKDQSNQCPACTVNNVTIRHSRITSVCQAFQIGNVPSDSGGWASGGNTYSIYDVLAEHLLPVGWRGCNGYIHTLGTDPTANAVEELHDVLLDHITEVSDSATFPNVSTGFLLVGGPLTPIQSNLVIENSIWPSLQYGIHNSSGSTSCAYQQPSNVGVLAACWNPLVYTNNLIAGGGGGAWINTAYPNNTVVASQSAIGYLDLTNGDYHLSPVSPGYKQATDGSDLGANIDLINQYTLGIE